MSGYESDTCGRSYTIRIRCVWTQIFLYPNKKICGYKNLRIRVDGVLERMLFEVRSFLVALPYFADSCAKPTWRVSIDTSKCE